jgi:hypothetical protein
MGLRVVLSTEPVHAALDRRVEQLSSEPISQRLLRVKPHVLAAIEFLADADPVLDGAAAALVHGVPVPVRFTDLLVARTKIDAVATQFARLPPVRWSEQHRRHLVSLLVDPRLDGAMQWQSSWGELRIKFVDVVPPSVIVRVPRVREGGFESELRVVAMDRIAVLDTELARLVDRVIERGRAHARDVA